MNRIAVGLIVLAWVGMTHSPLQAQGTWTQLTHPLPTGGGGTAILLSDGTVIVCASGTTAVSAQWSKLTPDKTGNYLNGTWSLIAPMSTARDFFASNLLPSGKLFVQGGEYSGPAGVQNFINTGEMYDPVANTWTPIATFPQPNFGDDPSVLLNNGKILCGYLGDGGVGGATDGLTYLYDPASNTWAQTGTKLNKDQSDEETWCLLPDGSVLSYDVFASSPTGPGTAQRYVPSTETWVATGPVPVPLTDITKFGAELGPMLLLPNGKVILFGANNKTVLYTPSTDTWAQGPSLPTNYGCDDAPAVLLPNGHVLFIADKSSPTIFTPPAKMFDYDPGSNSITEVTPGGTLGAIFRNAIAQQFCFLILPNGHVLMTTNVGSVWEYTPTGSPSSAWAPTITGIAQNSANTFTLSGTQLNGISEGSSFGDDCENSTNYPIVRLKSATGEITYARTTNWNPGIVASGSRALSTQFTVPSSLANGSYSVTVIANGIPSLSTGQIRVNNPTTGVNNVTADYNKTTKTLTLTGDATGNSLTVSYQNGVIRVEGASGTKINSTSFFTSAHSGKLVIVANLNDGDDNLSIMGVDSSNATINMGAGNDHVALTLCNFGNLTIDGGAGTADVLLTTSSKITTLVKTGFP